MLTLSTGSAGPERCQVVALEKVATKAQHALVTVPKQEKKPSAFGRRVLRICEDRGISLNDCGERAGIKSGPMSRLIRRPSPSLAKASAIADAWNISLDWLAHGRGPMDKGGQPWTEQEARYPNLAMAIDIARSEPWFTPELEAAATSIVMHYPEDLSVGTWLQQIELLRQGTKAKTFGRPVLDEDDTPPEGKRK